MSGATSGKGSPSATDRGNSHQRIINEDTPDVPEQSEINSYIDEQIEHYILLGHRDEWLWRDFRSDFARWQPEDFRKLSQKKKGRLRSFLYDNGVYVDKKKVVAEGLTQLLDEEEPATWPEAELQECIAQEGFKSRRKVTQSPLSMQITQPPLVTDQPPFQQTGATQAGATGATQAGATLSTSQAQSISQGQSPPPPPSTHLSQYPPLNPTLLQHGAQHGAKHGAQPGLLQQSAGPAAQPLSTQQQLGSMADHGRGIQTLFKIYQKEDKYSGADDVLDTKLRVFYDMCPKAGVNESDYPKAFSSMLTGEAKDYYFNKISGRRSSLVQMIQMLRDYFETEQRRERKTTEWENTTLGGVREKHPDKTLLECFDIMRNQLVKDQPILRTELQTDTIIRDRLYGACRAVPECNMALFHRSPNFQGASEELRNAIAIRSDSGVPQNFMTDDQGGSLPGPPEDPGSGAFYSDRKFQGKSTRFGDQAKGSNQSNTKKKCFVCKRFGCWSTNHTDDEQKRSFQKFKDRKWDDRKVRQYVIEIEGLDPDTSKDYEQFINEFELEEDDHSGHSSGHVSMVYTTESFGDIDAEKAIQELERQSILHAFSAAYHVSPKLSPSPKITVDAFLSSRYSTGVFMGIMIDTGAANRSTAGQDQFLALQKIQDVKLDKSRKGEAKVQFGIGATESLGTADVMTPIGKVTFHVVPADTPFLLSLKDLDDLGATFDNLKNVLIQKEKRTPIIRSYGHAWMLLDEVKALTYLNQGFADDTTVTCHLTDVELRRLHRRFGHPSTRRFYKVLQRAGHETNFEELARLTKFCEQCQTHGGAPGRFKFTLKGDSDFNHTLFVDVFTLDGKPVLHIVDEATNFQGGRFLKDYSTKNAWDTLREAWIDTYLGPPAYVAHDPGTNFASQEFRDNARVMNIEPLQKPVEAHHSIGRVERYHVPLRRAYNIIGEEDPGLSKQMRLQMAFKAVNDTAGPDGLVPTVLVFGPYPRMTWEDAPSTSIVARATAIKKAMADVRKCHAARKVADALNMRNGPLTSHLSELPLNSEVIVYREGRGWDRDPHRLLGMDGQTCQVEINGRAVNFRSTVVRPFLRDPHPIEEPRPQDAPVVGPNREGAPIEEHNHRENLPETTPRRSQRNIQPEPVAEPRQQPRNTRIEVRIPAFNPDEVNSFFTPHERHGDH